MSCTAAVLFHVYIVFRVNVCVPVWLYCCLPVRFFVIYLYLYVFYKKHSHIQLCLVNIEVFAICIFVIHHFFICRGVKDHFWHIFSYQELPRQQATCHAWHAKRD